ncbi:MAG: hypothetical protein F4185_05790 [Chloroflexi bacterium]|nr:hypothetical protein [Chloroflexota bacterium]
MKDGKAEGKWGWVTSMRDIAEEQFGASAGHLDAFDKLMELSSSSRIFAMSADTPPDVVASVREAFERVVSSDAFIADMKSRNYDVGLRTGNQYQAMVEGIANLPPETFEIIKGLFPESLVLGKQSYERRSAHTGAPLALSGFSTTLRRQPMEERCTTDR